MGFPIIITLFLLSKKQQKCRFLYLLSVCTLQKHPAATPASYPQVQAPIVNNPAFWERISMDGYGTGTDTLFVAFYYQQVK